MKKKTIPKLVKELDEIFAIYIKTRDTDENGWGKCCTCGASIQWWYFDGEKKRFNRNAQCGHAITRNNKLLRWNEWNAHLQCVRCNYSLEGRQFIHLKFIKEWHGEEAYNYIIKNEAAQKKLYRHELEEQIQEFKNLLKRVNEYNESM